MDIGGTFTDAVAVSSEGIRIAKVPSNPENPGQAVLAAVEALGLEEKPARFLHGTTLVTNMILERKGARTGFITSDGMRDIIHIGRHERPLTYAIQQEIPQQHYPPSPRKWRRTVPERVGASGEVIVAVDEGVVRQQSAELASEGVEAIAVGFLHSYLYPDHERKAAQWIQEEAPKIFVSTSSEVSPRFREYERFLTTVWNARVAPAAAAYLADLAREINKRWTSIQLTLMTSNGGLEEIDMATEAVFGDLRRTPIRLALSGPAAAGNAVARVSQDFDLPNLVGLDVGGTSSDIVVVRAGRLHEAPQEERKVGGYRLQIPMLDLHSIGAGGGSLVYRDEFGTLHVGPHSAGAQPGPACYGNGGTQPTVTDAAVVVGRLPSSVLLGGQMQIQSHLAHTAFARAFQTAGEGVIHAALEVLALTEANIAFAIRERTVARGLDPNELALVAAGGAGPLVACGVAETLELAEVIIPPRPGLLAAWGLLVAPDRREATLTVLKLIQEIKPGEAVNLFETAYRKLSQAPPVGAEFRQAAALRYLGQGFEVEITVVDPADLEGMALQFHEAHEHEYGFSIPHAPIEWVELRVAWEVPADQWAFPTSGGAHDETETHKLWELRPERTGALDRIPAQTEAVTVHRRTLSPGAMLNGPHIILEQDATIFVPTGWQAEVTTNGYLRIRHHER